MVGTTFALTTANRYSHGWLQRTLRAVPGLGIAMVYGVTVRQGEGAFLVIVVIGFFIDE